MVRRALGFGLALVIAAHVVVRADPAAPQVAPIHLEREDAQRLREQQRGLDAQSGAVAPGAAPGSAVDAPGPLVGRPVPAPAAAQVASVRGEHITGGVLLGISGVSAVVAVGYLTASVTSAGFDSQGQKIDNNDGSIAVGFLVVAVAAGITGVVLVTRRPTVLLTPTATASSVGLSLTGRL
jgi:hypothetical protein